MPSLFRRSNGIYYIVTRDKNGRSRWKSTGERTRPRALKHLRAEEKGPEPAQRSMRLSSFISEFVLRVSSFYSNGTLGIYGYALRTFLSTVGDLQLASVCAQQIDLSRQRRINEVSAITLNINLRALPSAFYYAVRWQLLRSNPFTKVPLSPVPERDPIFSSSEDFKLIVSSIKQEWFRAIVIFAACTALRRGQIVNLRWKDIDLSQKVVRVHSSGTYRTKNGKRRVVPLNAIALQLLAGTNHRTSEDYVFTIEGRGVRDLYLSRKFSQHVHRLGFPRGYHFHSLGHSFASWLVQNGAPIYEVQKLMGHSTIQVTEIYAHLAPPRSKVIAHQHLDGSLHLFWNEYELPFKHLPHRPSSVTKPPQPPPPNHPWRFKPVGGIAGSRRRLKTLSSKEMKIYDLHPHKHNRRKGPTRYAHSAFPSRSSSD